MSVCNEKASLREKKNQALQRHKDPDRRDRQENKTHQTPMPKMLPLITSYSKLILGDTVNLYLSLRKASIYVPSTGYCDYFGERERENSRGEGIVRLYPHVYLQPI